MKNDGIVWQHKVECLQILSKSYGYIFDTPFLTKELLFDAHSKTAADLYVCMAKGKAIRCSETAKQAFLRYLEGKRFEVNSSGRLEDKVTC